jgi:hypothetical protein
LLDAGQEGPEKALAAGRQPKRSLKTEQRRKERTKRAKVSPAERSAGKQKRSGSDTAKQEVSKK